MALKIITDSTADIPPAMARDLDITIVPLNVHFGDEVYRDGIDLSTDAFFERLPHSAVLPSTSQPSAGTFFETYQQLLAGGHKVLSLHISGKLSGTMNSALLAQRDLPPDAPLVIVDTQLASMPLGFVAIEAARSARTGATLAEAEAAARRTMAAVPFRLFLDTLEYLQRGGRIGRVQAMLGSLLSFKPVLTLQDGEMKPVERVRHRARAIQHLEEFAQSIAAPQEIAVMYSSSQPDDAEALRDRIAARFPGIPVFLAQIGPVIGVHLGPRAMGVIVRDSVPQP